MLLIIPDSNVLHSDPFLEKALVKTVLSTEDSAISHATKGTLVQLTC